MLIEVLPNDFIINPVIEAGSMLQSDFVIKAIRFVNDDNEKAELTKLAFDLYGNGKILREICYRGDALALKLSDGSNSIKGAGYWSIRSRLGSSIKWDQTKMTMGPKLEPLEETAIENEFFVIMSKPAVDHIVIRVSYKQGGEETTQQFHLPVINYKNKNNYTFPVKGVWQVNGNYDCLAAHRTQYSMEFAIDLGQLHSDGMFDWKANMQNEDYDDYGKEVLAVGDGEVVDCFEDAYWRINFPVDTASDEEKADRAKIEEKVGRLPIQCGNYVVIKHDNGEYSFYGHMIQHSLKVQKGMQVKQGDVIGLVGNVGYSGAPHLHFHLMDGPDFYSSRGLPCHFTNIVNCNMNPLSIIQEEYTIVKAK